LKSSQTKSGETETQTPNTLQFTLILALFPQKSVSIKETCSDKERKSKKRKASSGELNIHPSSSTPETENSAIPVDRVKTVIEIGCHNRCYMGGSTS